MTEKDLEIAEDRGGYQTLGVDHRYTKFGSGQQNQDWLGKDQTWFGHALSEIKSVSLATCWTRATPILNMLTGFLCMFITDGVMFTFPHNRHSLMEDIKRPPSLKAAGSLQLIVFSLSGPIAVQLCQKFGCRSVCIGGAVLAAFGFLLAGNMVDASGLFGGLAVLVGVGMSFIFMSSLLSMIDNESEHRFLVLGLSLSGIILARISFPAFLTNMVAESGWRYAYQSLAGLSCLCLLSGLGMRNLWEEAVSESFDSVGHLQERRIVIEGIVGKKLARSRKLREFVIACVGHAIAATAANIILVHKPVIEEYLGLEVQRSFFNIGFIIGGLMGLVFAGTSNDRSWFNPLSLTRNVVSCSAISPFLHTTSETAATTFILSAFFGFFTGLYIGLYLPLIISLLGPDLLPSGLAFITAVSGACQLILYIIVDESVDLSANPFTGFYTSGLLFGSAGLFYSVAIWLDEQKEQEQGMELEPLHVSYQSLESLLVQERGQTDYEAI